MKKINDLFQKEKIRIMGLMTGTSADELDMCLVEFDGKNKYPKFKIIQSKNIKLPSKLSEQFKNPQDLSGSEVASLHFELGRFFSNQIKNENLKIDIIASHGQTLFHNPPNFTYQIGEHSYIVNETNIPVIYDFRTMDVVNGGQGAPLIPIVDEYLFTQNDETVSALNLGGIANITIVPSKNSKKSTIAWDTGPANMLIDKAVFKFTSGREKFDKDGKYAYQGKLNNELLEWLLSNEYFQKQLPKSTGQETFGKKYFNEIIEKYKPKTESDWLSLIKTLTLFTVKSIATEFERESKKYSKIKTMFISGGGANNNFIVENLQKELPDVKIKILSKKDITTDNKEAFGFAYLGYLFVRRIPGNVPSVTGAKKECVLGKIIY
ncbi:MAG: anhydro-N-acetylmuramic acid kinase [Candidatus Marinimicrobia bacterium]|nr:anhydro-N-acetylmuramic acid kinase [Candidatus Neomarinimicrobiota bacterium]